MKECSRCSQSLFLRPPPRSGTHLFGACVARGVQENWFALEYNFIQLLARQQTHVHVSVFGALDIFFVTSYPAVTFGGCFARGVQKIGLDWEMTSGGRFLCIWQRFGV